MFTASSQWGRFLLAAGALVGLLTPTATLRADGRDALKVIPDSATAVIVVNNVRGTVDAVRKFADQVAPGALPPGDLLKDNLAETTIKDSFDDSNGAAVVVTDPSLGEQGLLLVIPVKDGKKALEDLKATAVEGEKDVFSADMLGKPAFVAAKDKFVLATLSKQTLLDVLAAKGTAADGFGASQVSALAGSDLWLRGNIKQALPLAQPYIGMVMMMSAQQPGMEGLGQLFTEINKILGDLTYADLGIKLDPAGVRLTGILQSKADSLLGKFAAAAAKNKPEGSLLAGLPAVGKPILVIGSVATYDAELAAWGEKLNQLTLSMPGVADEINKDAMDKALALSKEIAPAIKSSAAVITALPSGGDGLIGVAAVVRYDASGPKPINLVETTEKAIKVYQDLYKSEEITSVLKKITFKPNAGQIAGKPAHTLSFDLSGLGDEKEVAEITEGVKKVFGSDGLVARVIEVEPGVAVLVLGGGTKFAEDAVKAAGSKDAPLAKDAGIAKAAAQLQKDRGAEIYISVDNLVGLVKAVGEAMGEPAPPIAIKTLSSPAAISGGVVGTDAIRFDLFVPTDLILELKTLGDAMGGGAAPALPGGDF